MCYKSLYRTRLTKTYPLQLAPNVGLDLHDHENKNSLSTD